eukprot:863224-Prorocentrum_minimum.AAC.1
MLSWQGVAAFSLAGAADLQDQGSVPHGPRGGHLVAVALPRRAGDPLPPPHPPPPHPLAADPGYQRAAAHRQGHLPQLIQRSPARHLWRAVDPLAPAPKPSEPEPANTTQLHTERLPSFPSDLRGCRVRLSAPLTCPLMRGHAPCLRSEAKIASTCTPCQRPPRSR